MEKGAPLFEQVTIIGLGLIGSSIARAIRKKRLTNFIVGCDNNDTALHFARAHNYIDTAVRDVGLAVVGSQLVILASPPSSFASIGKKIASRLQPKTLIMDTASVKKAAIDALAPHLPLDVDFVPAHPVAGSEQSGGSAGKADLFQKRRVIITPGEPLEDGIMQTITRFWVAMGARVEGMPADMHDALYAYISHLPHLLAFAARNVIQARGVIPQDAALQKFLRLSASRVSLWREIFFYNREHLITALNRYLAAIKHIGSELTSVPLSEQYTFDDTLARTVLFPRVAASCLILAVIEAEKRAGISFARFAGRGFADFTSPATTPPDEHMETISNHHQVVGDVVKEYVALLEKWRGLMENGRFAELEMELVAEHVVAN